MTNDKMALLELIEKSADTAQRSPHFRCAR